MPQQVVIVLSTFERASKMMAGLEQVSSFARRIPGFPSLFPDGKSGTALVDAIEHMTARLEAGLKRIEENTSDSNALTVWEENRLKLIGWKKRIGVRAVELKSLKEAEVVNASTGAKEKKLTVKISGNRKPIDVWCREERGVLTELHDLLLELSLMRALKGDGNPIAEWDNIITTGTAARVFDMEGETRFGLMLDWYLSICAMVQAATYVRNAALAL